MILLRDSVFFKVFRIPRFRKKTRKPPKNSYCAGIFLILTMTKCGFPLNSRHQRCFSSAHTQFFQIGKNSHLPDFFQNGNSYFYRKNSLEKNTAVGDFKKWPKKELLRFHEYVASNLEPHLQAHTNCKEIFFCADLFVPIIVVLNVYVVLYLWLECKPGDPADLRNFKQTMISCTLTHGSPTEYTTTSWNDPNAWDVHRPQILPYREYPMKEQRVRVFSTSHTYFILIYFWDEVYSVWSMIVSEF